MGATPVIDKLTNQHEFIIADYDSNSGTEQRHRTVATGDKISTAFRQTEKGFPSDNLAIATTVSHRLNNMPSRNSIPPNRK